MILHYYKSPYKREAPSRFKGWRDNDPELTKWEDLCRNVWTINPSRDREHAATFPIEVPTRAIRLSSWPEETIVDPFCGSGTSGLAALRLGRKFIGVDINQQSIKIAEERLQAEEETQVSKPA